VARKFRRKKKTYQSFSFRKASSLTREEQRSYRNLFLISVFLLGFSALVYLKGIDFITFYSSLWQRGAPYPTSGPSKEENLTVPPPTLDPLPSFIKEKTTLKINGHASPNTKVVILINNKEKINLLSDSQGNFKTEVQENLVEGENIISAYCEDLEGKKSLTAVEQKVILDTSPPQLSLDNPADKETTVVDKPTILVSGHTESSKITVLINEYQAIVDLEGNFSYQLPLTPGENRIKITARDQAGHETTLERSAVYKVPETS